MSDSPRTPLTRTILPPTPDWYDAGRAQAILDAYNTGSGSAQQADAFVGESLLPGGTGAFRDFSYIAPEMPILDSSKCVGCMDCVVECPDTAILAKVHPMEDIDARLAAVEDPAHREVLRNHFCTTTKYTKPIEKKGGKPGYFGLFIDPSKCKGCAECVTVCNDDALEMVRKNSENLPSFKKEWEFFATLPDTPPEYINEKVLADMMLADRALGYAGGAGSCMGCGEASAIRMLMAATQFVYGSDSMGIAAATGCNTVYGATYPYNPFNVPWSNSLFENVATFAMGIRAAWEQQGLGDKKLWAFGGDGAMLDIGFQALSRLLASGMNVNVFIMDTQVYSNTGGQTSTGTFMGQEAKMSAHGSCVPGKMERRKEIGQLAMMHPDIYVAQTTPAHINHFYKAVMAANEFEGPTVINVYTTCQPEHGVADDMAMAQAKLAVDSRAFPLFVHDPRKGDRISERLSLQGNPAQKDDWYTNPKTGETIDFITFARSEGRFRKHFDKDGNPSEVLLRSQEDRRKNWRQLQELAGLL